MTPILPRIVSLFLLVTHPLTPHCRAWYLRLIGEDESNHRNHRKPEKRPPRTTNSHKAISENADDNASGHSDEKQQRHSDDDEVDEKEKSKKSKWSWVGHRSPLMDTREEAEWILDKLEQKLREELHAVVKESAGGQDALREVDKEERQNEQKKAPGA